jgi:hypothetical protein
VAEVHKWQQQPKLQQHQRWLARRSVSVQLHTEGIGAPARRATTNRANSLHSTGPRTETGKQRSSRTAVLPTEDAEVYQRHIQQFLDEYAPATATETQLVHEIPQLASLGLHGSRLSRQFQKTIDQLRYIQEERRQLTEAAEILMRHQRKGLPWEPSDDGFVFSKEQIECHTRKLMRQNPPNRQPPIPNPAPPIANNAPSRRD